MAQVNRHDKRERRTEQTQRLAAPQKVKMGHSFRLPLTIFAWSDHQKR
jgi:hypothetical protein